MHRRGRGAGPGSASFIAAARASSRALPSRAGGGVSVRLVAVGTPFCRVPGGRYPPTQWAKAAIAAYKEHKADRIVAEVNNGGEMVEATLRVLDPNVSYTA